MRSAIEPSRKKKKWKKKRPLGKGITTGQRATQPSGDCKGTLCVPFFAMILAGGTEDFLDRRTREKRLKGQCISNVDTKTLTPKLWAYRFGLVRDSSSSSSRGAEFNCSSQMFCCFVAEPTFSVLFYLFF